MHRRERTAHDPVLVGTIKSGVSLTSSGALDLDVTAVQVTGHVTIAGAPFPTDRNETGEVTFTQSGTTLGSSVDVAQDGSYATTLVAGTYEVGYDGQSTDCSGSAPALPCNAGTVKSKISLITSGGSTSISPWSTSQVRSRSTGPRSPRPGAAACSSSTSTDRMATCCRCRTAGRQLRGCLVERQLRRGVPRRLAVQQRRRVPAVRRRADHRLHVIFASEGKATRR